MAHKDSPFAARPARKRAPVFPASMLDRSLIDLLAQSQVPLSAYDIAERLRAHGRPMAVPSVYRSLDRLSAQGLVEKVEMLSAFRIKDFPKAMLMICMACGCARALPVPVLHEALERSVASTGFAVRTIALEVAGLCLECREQAAS